MKTTLKVIPLLLAGLLALPAQADETATSAASTLSAQPAVKRGILYRVRHEGHTGYLMGTIRFGRAGNFPIEGEAQQDFSDAGALLLDLDTRNKMPMQDAVKKYAMYQGSDTLDKHISPAALVLLKQVLEEAKIPYDIVSHMKPWMAANVLTAVTLERQGLRVSQATDTWFLNAAIAQKKTIESFSSSDDQLARFDSMNAHAQDDYLRASLLDLHSGATVEQTRELAEAWANADGEALDKLAAGMKASKSARVAFARTVLQERRNPILAARIEASLKDGTGSFACIDVMNLLGDKSVPQLLARDGFEVTRLY